MNVLIFNHVLLYSLSAHSRTMATFRFYLALWARLIEIVVRTTFYTFSVICACLYEEIGEQMEEMVENEELRSHEIAFEEFEGGEMERFEMQEELIANPKNIEKWKDDYENVRR